MKGVEENPGSRWRSATALTRYRDDGRLTPTTTSVELLVRKS
jgi:hypothetical protein